MSTRTQQNTTVNYSANNKVTEQLSKGMIYRQLMLELTSQPTLLAANNTAAKTLPGDDWAVIDRIDIVANSSSVLHTFTGEELRAYNMYLYGNPPKLNATLGDGATTANPSLSSVLTIPFWMPFAIRPIDTALDAQQLADFRIDVTWGNSTSINADAAAFTTSPVLKVWALEQFAAEGMKFAGHQTIRKQQTFSAAESAGQITLPVTGTYRSLLIHVENSSTGVDAATNLNNIKLKSGSTIFYDSNLNLLTQYGLQLRRVNQQDTFAKSADSDSDAWLLLDLVSDGFLTDVIDARGLAELELEVDVDATTQITVLSTKYIPPQG